AASARPASERAGRLGFDIATSQAHYSTYKTYYLCYNGGAGRWSPEHSKAPEGLVLPQGREDSEVTATLSAILPHLPAIVAALPAAHRGAACLIARGAALVAAGAVERVYNVFVVTSASTADHAYVVVRTGALLTCDCPDYANRGGPCKHGWAVVCFEAAERLD